jgi:chromosome segregation ATPase
MTKDSKTKSIGWFKGLSNQNENAHTVLEEEDKALFLQNEDDYDHNTISLENSTKKDIFSKDNQDKISLDLIVSLENMLQDRQLILYKNEGLENQLQIGNETISRLKHDLVKKEQLVQDKNKEIRVLESNLTNKQMSYDQLLEDYKEYQSASSADFEKISNHLEKEINKYNKLKEESTAIQHQNMLTNRELEEQIRNLEIDNQNFSVQYAKILDEKNELMQTINDFTERMSFSFSSKANNS